MYNPKEIFTKEGFVAYNAHIYNIEAAINYINNHIDDLHLGALDGKQEDDWCNLINAFYRLKPVLLEGDGEKDS